MRLRPKQNPSTGDSEATQARKRAERELERTRAQTPMYRDLGERIRELRKHNHLAEGLRALLLGEQQ
ncbi:MAG TPA: hypothetical protein VJ782_08760 [Aeromicrobium sp.]|nr:hypothetical protein [Aeromicrobium sp.]